jgi:cytosine/adenosine deaminase-related metal-dependent hydrolase
VTWAPAPDSRSSRRACRPTSCSGCSGTRASRSTSAGASALGLGDVIGDFSEGKEFDAILLRPPAGTALDIGLRHAGSPESALGKVFALASDADVADVWVGGEQVASSGFLRPVRGRAVAPRRTGAHPRLGRPTAR